MADNITLDPGSGGAVLATDDLSSVHHQYVKVEYGADNSATPVDASNPLPVRIGDGTDQILVDGSGNMQVILASNTGVDIGDVDILSMPYTDTDDDVVAGAQVGQLMIGLNYGWDGTQWERIATDAAGSMDVNITGGSVTVTHPAIGGGTEAGAQRVTIANDSTGLVSVDYAGTIPVFGAGTEAAAQRVTIANDSTGLVSVDDNSGSLTVDAPVGTPVNVQIGDGTDTALVDAAGSLQTFQPNLVSTNNSSTATLGISGNFTGTGDDVSNYDAVTVQIDASHDSATDGMTFEFSIDNTNWDDVYTFTYTASDGARRFQFPVTGQYFRVNYTNGGTGQSHFRLQTILHSSNVLTTIHRLVDNVHPDRSAELVKAAIVAQASGSGDFIPVQTSAGGNFKIDVEELAGNAVDLGNGVVGTGTQRVTIASDSTGALTVDLGANNDVTTELAGSTAVATMADNDANPDVLPTGAYLMAFDGATWDRVRGTSTTGIEVDIVQSVALDVSGATITTTPAVVGGGTEAAAQRVTIANDSTGTLTVDGTVSVTHPALGGGTEAGAQRVTIANDSTGTLTVDGTVTANAGTGDFLSIAAHTANEAQKEIMNIGGQMDDTTTVVATEGNVSSLRITAQRGLHSNLRDVSGAETGVVANPFIVTDDGNAILVDGSGVTQPVSGTVTVTHPALGGGVEAGAQRVTIANDSTGLVSVDYGGTVPVFGGGTEAAAQRVTIANDSTGTLTVDGTVTSSNTAGDVAHDTADSGNPVKVGGKAASSALPTAVANADRADLMVDDLGRAVNYPYVPRDQIVHNRITLTSTTETTLIAAAVATFHDLVGLYCSNESATEVRIDFRDDTAGTVRFSIDLAADGGGAVVTFPAPLTASATNDNWTAQLSAAVSTVYITGIAVANN